jgi:hypothetical protein
MTTHQPTSVDSDDEHKDAIRFFDKNSTEIFEAKQQWKQIPAGVCVCLHCSVHFAEREATKYCCPNHRKRHHEGKVYEHIHCEGCGDEMFPVFDYIVGNLCNWCTWLNKHTGKSRAEYDLYLSAFKETKEYQVYHAYRMEIAERYRGIMDVAVGGASVSSMKATTHTSYVNYCAAVGVEPSLIYYEMILDTIGGRGYK